MQTPKEQILQFIMDNPSAHLRKIKNTLGYSMGTIQYHILHLEKEGKIYHTKDGFYKNYFHISEVEEDNVLMGMLNLDSPRKILIYLLNNEPCSHHTVSQGVGLTSSTVSWHMKKLVELGLVRLQYDGKFSVYSLKNREKIIQLLGHYKDSTWNDMVSNMTDLFTTFQQ